MTRDLKNNLAVVHLLDAQDVAGVDTNSSLLDTQGFDGAAVAVNVGALTGVSGSNYLTPVLQECDTTAGASFTDVAADDIEGAFTKMDAASEDQTTQAVGYKGSKRYIRVKLDFTGTITASPVAVIGLLGLPHIKPAVAVAPVAAT